jgi:hypothetical protein
MIELLEAIQLQRFYGWWQFAVSLVAFLGLMSIWWHIGRKQKDFGQVWLALSVLCWSASGLIEVYCAHQYLPDLESLRYQLSEAIASGKTASSRIELLYMQISSTVDQMENVRYGLEGWRSVLSLFNSLFILCALPWFRYIPGRLDELIKSKYWYVIIGLPFLFSLLPTLSKIITARSIGLISELDVYYGFLTLIFLGAVLWESFRKRRLPLLAWLTVAVILFTFVAQLYKLTDSNLSQTLFSAIFKTSLIMLFFALALSWVKELAQNIIPPPYQLFLNFNRQKNDQGKLIHEVHFKGFPGVQTRTISLTPMAFNLLHTFAERKKNETEGWLEIKPKGEVRSGKTYDIKDHNELKRLLTSLLDGLFGKDHWSKEQHYHPLKACLFELSEKRERKIRLRIPANHMELLDD